MKKIVTIGGGTGTFNLLSGLKKENFDISAVVSMADSGGSNRIIRDEFGMLPISDARQSLAALVCEEKSDFQKLMQKLFMYRFEKGGGIKGMTLGNLFIAALTDILGDQLEAIKKTADILKINGKVIPVTDCQANLIAIYENGTKIEGEHKIDDPEHDGKLKIKKIFLNPPATANPEALKAIEEADLVILGPGDLYTSIVANLVVDRIGDSLKKTKAKIMYVVNLMTSFGETYGMSASDHVEVIKQYISGRILDYVLMNSEKLPEEAVRECKKENNFPVYDDLNEKNNCKIIRRNLLSYEKIAKNKADSIKRSIIRHDGGKMAEVVKSIL